MNNEARIKIRIIARNDAAEHYEMLMLSDGTPPWFDGHGADYAEAFLEKLAELLPKRRVAVPQPAKSVPLERLGSTLLLYGQHKGKTFDETPIEYLDWLCRANEDMAKDLRDYLTHPEIKIRRGECP